MVEVEMVQDKSSSLLLKLKVGVECTIIDYVSSKSKVLRRKTQSCVVSGALLGPEHPVRYLIGSCKQN